VEENLKVQEKAVLKKLILAQLAVQVLMDLVQQMYSENVFVARAALDVDFKYKNIVESRNH
jgi:hypothetical protein